MLSRSMRLQFLKAPQIFPVLEISILARVLIDCTPE